MNNFSALDTSVAVDELEVNFHFQTRFIFRPQHILNDNIFYKSECVLFRY